MNKIDVGTRITATNSKTGESSTGEVIEIHRYSDGSVVWYVLREDYTGTEIEALPSACEIAK